MITRKIGCFDAVIATVYICVCVCVCARARVCLHMNAQKELLDRGLLALGTCYLRQALYIKLLISPFRVLPFKSLTYTIEMNDILLIHDF